ncbi:MAG: DUF2721 domain-containing protein [Natronospirillum sp.]
MNIESFSLLEFSLTTPALLFPAISLLFLAYTNRFIVISQLIRSLYKQHQQTPTKLMRQQIDHLRLRVWLIRMMQAWGVGAFIFCILSMLVALTGVRTLAIGGFVISLLALLVSLVISLYEIWISGYALRIQLKGLKKPQGEITDHKDTAQE